MGETSGAVPGPGAWYAPSVARFQAALDAIGPDDWGRPTPCADWDVRALVAHVVDEHRWVAPLLAGRTIADVGPELGPDPLAPDPSTAWRTWSTESLAAVAALDDPSEIVHLSFGDVPASEYLAQLTADHVVHAWDLARAIGADEHLDPAMVDAVASWFEAMEPMYRGAGVIGDRAPVRDGASAQDRLLAAFGRDVNR